MWTLSKRAKIAQKIDNFFYSLSGATHSTLIIANGHGEILAKVNGESSNHWMIGIPEVGRRIAAMTKEAKQIANIPDSVTLKCIGLSLSGCEQDSTNANLEREIRKEFPDLSENYVVCSDTLGSILTVSNLGGMVVIAGTGSNALLRNPNGGKFIKIFFVNFLSIFENSQTPINAEVGDMQLAMKVEHGGLLIK